MNPSPLWPCGLASDTRRALAVKIHVYLTKIHVYLGIHVYLTKIHVYLTKIQVYLTMKSRDGAPGFLSSREASQ